MTEEKGTKVQAIGGSPELEKMSIAHLLVHLKIAQLWGTLAIISGLIGGAFVIGYKTSSTVTDAKLNSMQIELDDAKSTITAKENELTDRSKEVANYKKKDRFLSLFLRHEQQEWNDPGALDEYSAVRDALDEYVLKFIDESEKDESFVKFGKGQARETTVTFWDGAKWTIPPDLRAATLD